MNLDELLLLVEKNKEKLHKIDDNFYNNLRMKIKELEERINSANETDALKLEDELKTIKRIQKKIFEIRTGRIISIAWAEVCGQPVEEEIENMTSEEKNFFKKLVELIKEFKKLILEGIERKEQYILVRVKRDVEIQGVDGKTYKLRREDVVTLPEMNAEALIKSGIAEKIEVKG